jgi:hypothetical protein
MNLVSNQTHEGSEWKVVGNNYVQKKECKMTVLYIYFQISPIVISGSQFVVLLSVDGARSAVSHEGS